MLYTDCPGGRTDAVARHVSFVQITCFCMLATGRLKASNILIRRVRHNCVDAVIV